MYKTRLEIDKDPLVGKGWSLPRQFRGATLGNRVPPSVDAWMSMAATGKVFNAVGAFAGSGLTIVASDLADEEWVTALISDLLRRSPGIVNAQSVLMTTLADLNDNMRENRLHRSLYLSPKILIVSSVTTENEWALAHLANLFESRYQRGLPTIVLVDSMSWKILTSIRSPSASLSKSLPNRNIVVEV